MKKRNAYIQIIKKGGEIRKAQKQTVPPKMFDIFGPKKSKKTPERHEMAFPKKAYVNIRLSLTSCSLHLDTPLSGFSEDDINKADEKEEEEEEEFDGQYSSY